MPIIVAHHARWAVKKAFDWLFGHVRLSQLLHTSSRAIRSRLLPYSLLYPGTG
jgi:hypothetical protein